MAQVLDALLNASERAACVARSCCSGSFNNLLISEKGEGEANPRFAKDFKTIADVLAQEAARKEVAMRCPELALYFRGEECAEIGGVSIRVQDSSEETAELLGSLVSQEAAKNMAKAAHQELKVALEDFPTDLPNINPADLGVWIDPIDATAEFIAGVKGEANANCGLQSVTVLIGAYERSTGQPVMGVINQPFYNNGQGRIIWGYNYEDMKKWGCSIKTPVAKDKIIVMSSSEDEDVIAMFEDAEWNVQFLPGAGYKMMKVALGEATAYLVSKGTTFRWDTCGPHAILRARGGDLLSFKSNAPITYNDLSEEDAKYCNSYGIIAYTDINILNEMKLLYLQNYA